jgi:hypothetical protein
MLINVIRGAHDSHNQDIMDSFLKAMGAKGASDRVWPLPNLKKITEAEFWHWRTSYTPCAEANLLQIQLAKVDPESKFGHPQWGTPIVYFLNHSELIGGGFVVVHEYNYSRVTYYTWSACDHTFQGKTIGNCLNRYTCTKCNNSYEIDSSD